MADAALVLNSVKEIAGKFASQRHERQLRRELDAQDFKALRDAGFLLTGVPVERGGLWVDIVRSTRAIAEILRALAAGDSSVALVSAMHPAVLSFWLATSVAPAPYTDGWTRNGRRLLSSRWPEFGGGRLPPSPAAAETSA
ncbi:MAG TPA: acyl-CoA dehydrogenase family protein [Candidatus Binatia bacterium]|jgi:alkylation response protein AidB-like acyl-CoA dehydrogenase|nr:acyl-CoA dehydrogenase family protein [Candidatus Binatia bacterium]